MAPPDDYASLDQCRPDMAYKLNSRNLAVGVYNGNEGFIGIREKFGRRYLFTEYIWTRDRRSATHIRWKSLTCPKPLSELNEALFAWLDGLEQRSGVARTPAPDRRWYTRE